MKNSNFTMLRLRCQSLSKKEKQEIDPKDNRKKLDRRLDELDELIDLTITHRKCPTARSKIVLIRWNSVHNAINIVFNNGIITWLFYDSEDLKELTRVYIDKYLTGKLSDYILDFEFLYQDVLLCCYAEPRATVFIIKEDRRKSHNNFKLKNKSHISKIDIDLKINGSQRRVKKYLLCSHERGSAFQDHVGEKLFLIYWQNGKNFISPWVQNYSEFSNLFVYTAKGVKVQLLSSGTIMNDILKVEYSNMDRYQLLTVESENAMSHLILCKYEIPILMEDETDNRLIKISSMKIPLETPYLKVKFTSNQDKCVILCKDGSIILFHIDLKTVYSFRTSINAVDVIPCPLDSFFIVCDQFGQILMYDYGLNVIPANYDELKLNECSVGLLEVKFLNNNLISVRFFNSSLIFIISLPFHMDNLSLMNEYLKYDYINEAIAHLNSFNWNRDSFLAYNSLNTIFNYLLKEPLNSIRESQIQSTLSVFFNPINRIAQNITDEFKFGMHCSARKFFYHLLRYSCFEKAFLLALDLNSRQLFLTLYKMASERGNQKLAEVSLIKANEIKTKYKMNVEKPPSSLFNKPLPLKNTFSHLHNEINEDNNNSFRSNLSLNDQQSPCDTTIEVSSAYSTFLNNMNGGNSELMESYEHLRVPPNLPPRKVNDQTFPPPPLPPKRCSTIRGDISEHNSQTGFSNDSSKVFEYNLNPSEVEEPCIINIPDPLPTVCLPIRSSTPPRQLTPSSSNGLLGDTNMKNLKIQCVHFGVV